MLEQDHMAGEIARASSAERQLMWKIDLWVIPTLVIVFLCSFIDKVNIANAKIFGLAVDLQLKGSEFNTSLVIFFVAYVVFDIPCTIALKIVRPHIWLSAWMFLFGIISMLQGFVTDYGGLLAVRFFLGIAEACVFSGCFCLLARWYQRSEAQKRFTFFYSSAQLAAAFAGLLASAIGLLDGRGGYPAWRWLFIIEGACTAAIAMPMFFVIPDFPEQTRWLSATEKRLVQSRLGDDRGEQNEKRPLTLKTTFFIIAKPKVLVSGLLYFTLLIPGYSYVYFTPTIIKSYTAGSIRTQLLSVPPWACGFVAALTVAYVSDRLQHRFLFVVIPLSLAIPGYIVLLAVHHDSATQYAGIFLVNLGLWVAPSIIVCWCAMNVHGNQEQMVALGWLIGFGNAAGIPAVYLFLQSEGPRYTKGYTTSLILVVVAMILATVYAGLCWRENNRIMSEEESTVERSKEELEQRAGQGTNVSTRVVNII